MPPDPFARTVESGLILLGSSCGNSLGTQIVNPSYEARIVLKYFPDANACHVGMTRNSDKERHDSIFVNLDYLLE